MSNMTAAELLEQKRRFDKCIEILKKCKLELEKDNVYFNEENLLLIISTKGYNSKTLYLKKCELSFIEGFVTLFAAQKQIIF